MTKWYVKDLSKLTGVSVQTLHHYDRIGLLKPSLRLDNGYRVYSEQDLSRLQQIIALKFFGFELARIKELLKSDLNVLEHFAAQSCLLEKKAQALLDASHKLQHIVNTSKHGKSIPWKNIIETIEVYRMTEELNNTWAREVLSADEFKQYVEFSKGLDERFTADDKEEVENAWANLLKEINASLKQDPNSDQGYQIAQKMMDWLDQVYGKEYIELRIAIWEKGFQKGRGAEEHGLSAEAVEWLDKAFDHYYGTRIRTVLLKAGKQDDAVVLREWDQLMQEMCGDSKALRKKVEDKVLHDSPATDAAKKLLRK